MQIIVTGSNRGGTTAVAGVIRSLGINFPDANDRHENAGLFEDFIEERWDTLSYQISAYTRTYLRWGWKYPAITRFPSKLSTALPYFSNPIVVCVWRDVYSIATHRMKNNNDTTLSRELKRLNKEIENQIASIDLCACPILHISYEKLITYPTEQVIRIQQFINADPSGLKDAISYIKPGQYQPWTKT